MRHPHRLIITLAAASVLMTGCVGSSGYQGADGSSQTAGPGSSALSVKVKQGTEELTAVSNFAKDLDATDVTIKTPSGYEFHAKRWTSGSANGTRGVEAMAAFAQQLPAIGSAVAGSLVPIHLPTK